MFPLDGIQEPEGPRWNWPVTLRSGHEVPFDVLLATWATICRLNYAGRASLLLLSLGRRDVPWVMKPLLKTLGFLDERTGRVTDDVRHVVLDSVDLARLDEIPRTTAGMPMVRWTAPAPGLTPDEGAVL